MAADNVVKFTDGTWDDVVLKGEQAVVVDFWAEWCGPCRMLAPTIDALATEYAGKVAVGKLNVDENPATAMKYSVRGIPTVMVFKGGQMVDQIVGLVDKDALKKVIDRHV
ncbi:MAG: thioredoxin [Acidobacteriota bacterium]|nr:thioredoxin [Acidobacteriota bacterium]